MSRVGILLLFLVALVVGLAIRMPADFVVAQAASRLPPGVELGPAEGTVWSGRIERVVWRGIDLGRVTWQVDGVDFAGLGPRLAVSLDGPDGQLTGTATPGVFGTLSLSGISGSALPKLVADVIGFRGMTFTGSVRVSDVALDVSSDGVAWQSGRIDWRDAGMSEPLALALGNTIVDIAPDDAGNGVLARLTSSGGDIGVDGRMTLAATGAYQVDIALVPTENLSAEVGQMIALVAPPNPAGVHRLVRDGRLWN